MTHNDVVALEYLAKCSGWTEAPANRDGKPDLRFMGSIGYLIVTGYARSWSVDPRLKNKKTYTFYRITSEGREALQSPPFDGDPPRQISA